MENIKYLLGGFVNNLYFSIVAIFFGFIVGFFFASLQFAYKGRWIEKLVSGIVSVICGTPILVQLMIYYYIVPTVVKLPNMWCAAFGIAFNSACYFSLIFLDAMSSIDDTYFVNLSGLNISKFFAIRRILLPMIIDNSYNKITFEFISLLKETAILSSIGISDICARSKEIVWRGTGYFTSMMTCAFIFYIFYIIYKKWLHLFVNKMLVGSLKLIIRFFDY